MFDYDKRIFKNFSYLLIIQLLPLFYISSYLIYEINQHLFQKQMIYYGIAAVAFVVAALIPWRRILWWFAPLFYIVNLALLVAVEFVGKTILGAQRWIEIPGIGITIQPSEFMKVNVIMMLAYLISKKPPPKSGYGLIGFFVLSLVIIIPFVVIAKEPDLGTALVLLLTGYGILFIIGIDWKIWVTIFLLGGAAAPLVYEHGLKPYQKKRIHDMINKPSYQVRQALIAIGSGGIEGKSKEEATQTQLKFLPVSSTDFIFAYLGERFGLKGMVTVISLYILLILHLLYLSAKYSRDYLIKTFSSGLAWLFFVYMGVNVFMIIGLAPVVGLPLPMFSHGGTSFIIFAVMFGILQNLIAFKDYNRYTSDAKISMQPKAAKQK
ncbi:FtsW/RodA/SpoVE family cell cycle protein [Sulfurovum sp. NBC37-1]|uniref:FtsW/RodA/SpoVE family cell cycle protein n=1 Tax=Sulfurovum sp. (strain NBC37-1) TaxID=387093 RepID=UPI0001587D54|nr:FtsW/RodA/SpoVE family cell cycle protein [Sulfurovum sp. NBC37-1]BAF72325.1 cell shape-determining protein RodA [Sulfurovum sp. NBC37-1]